MAISRNMILLLFGLFSRYTSLVVNEFATFSQKVQWSDVYFSLRGFLAFDIYDEKLLWDFSTVVADISATAINSIAGKYFLKWNIHTRNTKDKITFI